LFKPLAFFYTEKKHTAVSQRVLGGDKFKPIIFLLVSFLALCCDVLACRVWFNALNVFRYCIKNESKTVSQGIKYLREKEINSVHCFSFEFQYFKRRMFFLSTLFTKGGIEELILT